jgi:kynurenine formamidase
MEGEVPGLTADDVARYHRELSNWGRWGERDQLGTLNLVTPDKRRAAAALVTSGRAVGCGRALDTLTAPDNDRPVLHHMIGTASEGWGGDCYPMERVTAHGARELGIQALRHGVVSRGILLDAPRLTGSRWLEPGDAILPENLEQLEQEAELRVEPGDVLLVRTGRWALRAERGAWEPHDRLAGLHASCLPWLYERGVAALGSDGVSDLVPSQVEDVRLPIHSVAIVAMGLHLLDNLELESLAVACAEEQRWSFLLTLAPLVIEGGTASPLNPIAVL